MTTRATPKKWASIGAVAGAVTILITWVVKTFAGIEVPVEVAGSLQAVITYLVQQFSME
jgi:ABC-type molybdate transport system substrate-binding protein